jgi:hypothetical protein
MNLHQRIGLQPDGISRARMWLRVSVIFSLVCPPIILGSFYLDQPFVLNIAHALALLGPSVIAFAASRHIGARLVVGVASIQSSETYIDVEVIDGSRVVAYRIPRTDICAFDIIPAEKLAFVNRPPCIVLRWRDRLRKVLHAETYILPDAPWFMEAASWMADYGCPLRIKRKPCSPKEFLVAARALLPRGGRRSRKVMGRSIEAAP